MGGQVTMKLIFYLHQDTDVLIAKQISGIEMMTSLASFVLKRMMINNTSLSLKC